MVEIDIYQDALVFIFCNITKEIVDKDSSVSLQKEDGTYIVFDTMECIKIFQRLTDIYGDAFDKSCL